jgi:hypothetical protein
LDFNNLAKSDFGKARSRAFWRSINSRLVGETNELLPFDEVRQRLAIRGQHYRGLEQVSIDQIIGSAGRFRDFDRVFLPIHERLKDRWVNIDKAYYDQIYLPPVDLYKMGEVFFVRDGNHRVSVARQRSQEYIDAYVTEIDVSVPITVNSDLEELTLAQERINFIGLTELTEESIGEFLQSNIEGQYSRLLEHIAVHRWYLGEHQQVEIPFSKAAKSWYENVYRPVIEVLIDQDISKTFKKYSLTDIYLFIMEYQAYLRETYQEELGEAQITSKYVDRKVKKAAGKQLAEESDLPTIKKLISLLINADWVNDLILDQERAFFYQRTRIKEILPDAKIKTTRPGEYETLLNHIDVHRWYLGEQHGTQVSYPEAVTSWFMNVYMPIVNIIRNQHMLEGFPDRTETDLYLWIISRQWFLQEAYGTEISPEIAAEQIAPINSKKKSR